MITESRILRDEPELEMLSSRFIDQMSPIGEMPR
jgi:hypothetical protein